MTFAPEIEEILSKPTIRVMEMAKLFGLSRNAAYDAVRNGDFETIKVGGSILILTIPLRKKLGLSRESNDAINS